MPARPKQYLDRKDFTILLELKKYPPSSMRQIGEILGVSHVTIKQRMDWLHDQGFIGQAENAPVGSARSRILTEKGFQYIDENKLREISPNVTR